MLAQLEGLPTSLCYPFVMVLGHPPSQANFSPHKPFGSPSRVKGCASTVSSGNNCPSQQCFFSFKPPIKLPQLGE